MSNFDLRVQNKNDQCFKTHRGSKAPVLDDGDKDNAYSKQQPSMRRVGKFFFLEEKQAKIHHKIVKYLRARKLGQTCEHSLSHSVHP